MGRRGCLVKVLMGHERIETTDRYQPRKSARRRHFTTHRDRADLACLVTGRTWGRGVRCVGWGC